MITNTDVFISNLERRQIPTPSEIFVFWILSGPTVSITFSTTPTAGAMTERLGVFADLGRTQSTQNAHCSLRLDSSCANAHSASLRTRSSIFNVATGSKTPHAHAYCDAVCRSHKICLTLSITQTCVIKNDGLFVTKLWRDIPLRRMPFTSVAYHYTSERIHSNHTIQY